jgi:hypothetical protein
VRVDEKSAGSPGGNNSLLPTAQMLHVDAIFERAKGMTLRITAGLHFSAS